MDDTYTLYDTYTVLDITNHQLRVQYINQFLTESVADSLLSYCFTLGWGDTNHRSTIMFGDEDLLYTLNIGKSNIHHPVNPWSDTLLKIKDKIQSYTEIPYNFCALMRYPNGKAIIKKHRDKEMAGAAITGLSVGSTRRFRLSQKLHDAVTIPLHHGSLYYMQPPTNDHWLHEIMEDDTVETRFSLTFRYCHEPMHIRDVTFCTASLKSGAHKGTVCGVMIVDKEQYCKRHRSLTQVKTMTPRQMTLDNYICTRLT